MALRQLLDTFHRFMDYDELEARRVATRSAGVDLDIALTDALEDRIAAAVRRGSTTTRTYPTSLLKPRDITRVTREVMAVLRADEPVYVWPADDPTGEVGDVETIRRAVN